MYYATCRIMRTEQQVKVMLRRMKLFEKRAGQVPHEMNGEMLALEYVLEKLDNLF